MAQSYSFVDRLRKPALVALRSQGLAEARDWKYTFRSDLDLRRFTLGDVFVDFIPGSVVLVRATN